MTNETEQLVHPVFQTQLQLRPNFYTDTTFGSETITLAEILNYRIPSNPNVKEIKRARSIRPQSEEDYKKFKLKSQGIYFNGYFETVFENYDVRSFTNLLFFDVDSKENPSISFNDLRNAIIQLPYIVSVWTSYGGEGIGFIALSSGIDSDTVFKNAHEQIREDVTKHFGKPIIWDNKVCHVGRGCSLSFDPDIWTNDNPEPFVFDEKNFKNKKKNEHQYKDIEIDPELKTDVNLIEEFSFLSGNYYENMIITNLETGLPVLKTDDFEFDKAKHGIQKTFSSEIISKFKIKNENNSMAYHSDGFECIKIKMGENFYFPHKRRAKTLTVIMYNYLFINGLRLLENEKNQIYNMLLVLNSRCVKHKPKKGEQPNYYPLEDSELNKLATKIYNKYLTSEIVPYTDNEGTKSICSESFLKEWLLMNSEYSGDKHPRTIKLKEIKRIKQTNNSGKYSEFISEMFDLYPNLKASEYIEIFKQEFGFNSFAYAKKVYYKSVTLSGE